jgi:hypothetical protein
MNSFLVNEVNDIGVRLERSERVGFGSTPIHEILKKFCCFNNSFNSFKSFLCFRVFFLLLFQYVINANVVKNNRNEDISNHNEDISNHNEDISNLVMWSKIIYNGVKDDARMKNEFFLSD